MVLLALGRLHFAKHSRKSCLSDSLTGVLSISLCFLKPFPTFSWFVQMSFVTLSPTKTIFLIVTIHFRYPQTQLVEVDAHSLFSKWFSESGKLVRF